MRQPQTRQESVQIGEHRRGGRHSSAGRSVVVIIRASPRNRWGPVARQGRSIRRCFGSETVPHLRWGLAGSVGGVVVQDRGQIVLGEPVVQ